MQSSVRLNTALLALLLSSTAAPAATTYFFVDYPTMQGGYTLTGQITTDDTIGTYALSSSHILSWNYTLSQGEVSLSLDNTVGGVDLIGDITVTSTTIAPVIPDFQQCGFFQGTSRLSWYGPQPGSDDPFMPMPGWPAHIEYTGANWAIAIFTDIPGSAMADAGNVIARTSPIPEPASLGMLGLAAGAFAMRRRRRA